MTLQSNNQFSVTLSNICNVFDIDRLGEWEFSFVIIKHMNGEHECSVKV